MSGSSVVPGLPKMMPTPSCFSSSRKARFPEMTGILPPRSAPVLRQGGHDGGRWRQKQHRPPFVGRAGGVRYRYRRLQRHWAAAESRSDGFLELLGGAERHLLAGLDLDRLAGGGIAAHPRRALAYDKDTESADADPIALLQVLHHHVDHAVKHGLGLLF